MHRTGAENYFRDEKARVCGRQDGGVVGARIRRRGKAVAERLVGAAEQGDQGGMAEGH